MNLLYWLDQIESHHLLQVGNKALLLSRSLQKHYPVVPGFVISAGIFRQFLEQVDWLEPLFSDLPHSSLHVDIENSWQLQSVAQQIRRAIAAAPFPDDLLTCLSSALAQFDAPGLVLRASLAIPSESWAGTSRWNPVTNLHSAALFDSVFCRLDVAEAAIALKRLWAQVFSAKSLFYWQRLGIPVHHLRFAVIVQPLQPAIAAGTIQLHQATAEVRATVGMGIAIDRGEVSPAVYHVTLPDGTVHAHASGSRTIAYRVTNGSTHDGFQPLENQNVASPPFQPYLLSEQQQQQPVLHESDLQEIVKLVQRAHVDWGAELELGWFISSTRDRPSRLFLTQLVPHLTSGALSKPSVPAPTNSASIASNQVTELSAEVGLLVSGIGASPGTTIARATLLTHTSPPGAIEPGTILVAPAIPLDWLPLLQQAAGVVSEQGGMTCHSAIVARELGVPAVMAAVNATQRIQPGELVLIDGTHGKVYQVAETTRDRWSFPAPANASVRQPVSLRTPGPPLRTRLLANLSQTLSLPRLTGLPLDGIGLLRSELLALNILKAHHPSWWLEQGRNAEMATLLAEQIQQFTEALFPRPVFFRALDLRSHEFSNLLGGAPTPEPNPMLGVRGTFSYRLNPDLLRVQLAALSRVQQAGYSNLRLLLPFVRTLEEFQFCRELVEQAGLTANPQFQLWIMAEVPSVLFLLPEFVQAGVQGISIGTNDLTQLLLAADRDQPQMAAAFDERHPAVLAAIAQLIRQANQLGILSSICGQAPVRFPDLVEKLVRWGVTAISVEPEAVESTYQAIAQAERKLASETASP